MTERPNRRNETLRETWFGAAHEILAAEGYGALKLAPLCKRLGVTTGSFYHSFDNWQDFTASLLANWMRERTEATVEIAKQTEDPVARLRLLLQASGELMHRMESAIRVWAGTDPEVAAIQEKVDQGRYNVVHDAMSAIVGPEHAEDFTVFGLSVLIGYEMMSGQHGREHLIWSLEAVLADAERVGKQQKRSAAATTR
jgi:AcrR family transcriptional regulator